MKNLSSLLRQLRVQHFLRAGGPPGGQPGIERRVVQRQNRRREQPALAAPGLPTASVATGIPLGICTIESNESSPFSGVATTGTPSTGSSVLAAMTPAR